VNRLEFPTKKYGIIIKKHPKSGGRRGFCLGPFSYWVKGKQPAKEVMMDKNESSSVYG
jgi:hypothetical protein